MKKVRINKKGEYKDTRNQTFHNYKVFLFGRGFWISELDFKETESLKTDGENLFLKEPLENHYQVVVKNSAKGSFLTLKPIISTIKESIPPAVGEPDIEYQNKTKTQKEEEATKIGEQQKSNEEVWNKIKSGKKSELDQLLGLDNQPTRLNSIISKLHLDPRKQIFPSEDEIKAIFEEFPEFGVPKKTEPVKLQPKLDPKKQITPGREEMKELAEDFPELSSSLHKTPTAGPNYKFQFMQTLLKLSMKRNVKERTQEKLLELVGKEIEKDSLSENRIIEEINELKGLLTPKIKEIDKMREQENKEKALISKHRPKDTAELMSLFSMRNGFKWLVHDYDEVDGNFQIRTYLETCQTLFLDFTKSHYIPKSLYSIINQFSFAEKPLWGNRIEIGWSHPKWIDWCEKTKLHPMQNPDFYAIIQKFRELTRIEPPNLEPVIKEEFSKACKMTGKNMELELIDCHKADIYTFSKFFKDALNLIFEGIAKRSDISNQCKVHYIRRASGDYKEKIIRICHTRSFLAKPIDELIDQLSNSMKGDFHSIREKLRGYCDWSIETKYEGDGVKLNILSDQDGVEIIPDEEAGKDGFTHILTFYGK